MSKREHTWELLITAFSWLVAIMALAAIILFVVYDAYRGRRRRSR